jgi:hypothetical protein
MPDLLSHTDGANGPWWLGAAHPAVVSTLLQRDGYALLTAGAVAELAADAAVAPDSPDTADSLHRLASHWHDLPSDQYLKDGGKYRRRRHGSYVQDLTRDELLALPHRAHWQPTTYNALHGGMLRWFEPLAPAMAASPVFIRLIAGLGRVFAAAAHTVPGQPAFDGRWFIEAHPFRIDTTGGVGRPTPEGAHRDGVGFVAVLLVDRASVTGGETRVFEAHGPYGVRFTLVEPWSALLLDDARVIHESTPIQPLGEAGHRDTLVLTYRAGGFQDPPPA